MRELRNSLVFSALSFMLGLALLGQAVRIKPVVAEPMGPEVYPAVIAVLMIAAAFFNLVLDFARLRKLRLQGSSMAASSADAGAPEGFAWQAPLAIALLGICYVAGLTFVGFFVSTFCFTLATMATLHGFEGRPGLARHTLTVYLALSGAIVAALFVGIKALRIYIPTQTWLW